jgi:hypothetical protein
MLHIEEYIKESVDERVYTALEEPMYKLLGGVCCLNDTSVWFKSTKVLKREWHEYNTRQNVLMQVRKLFHWRREMDKGIAWGYMYD